ncbi:MAG: acetate--CoA ligase family protein [Actinomycetota bacterium]|nr:acetate--CoA ligase family protein [Actinomycetota bacterium]
MNEPLARLLAPRRVGVIGSMSAPTKPGARTVAHLEGAGFAGEVFAARTVDDLLADAGDDELDAVCLAVPAKAVRDTLDALDGRAANVIVYSSGFAETGDGDLRAYDRPGMRILGPNTVGLYHAPTRAVLTFAAVFDELLDAPGGSGVWLAAHSGALGARLVKAAARRGLHLDGFVAPGNEDGYTMAELITGLVDGPVERPRVVLLYLEGVRDGPALFDAVDHARRAGVAVVALVGGRSDIGAEAASSHTAAVSAGGAALADVLTFVGAHVVHGDVELIDAAVGLANNPRAARAGATILTGSGGAGVVAADVLSGHGIALPPPSDGARARLAELLPSFASLANPVDVTATGIGNDTTVRGVVDTLVDDLANGMVAAGTLLTVARDGQAPLITEAAHRRHVPAIVAVLDGGETETAAHVAAGRAVLPSLAQGAVAASSVAAMADGNRPESQDLPAHEPAEPGGGRTRWSAAEAYDLVEGAGLTTPRRARVTTIEDARTAAERVGWPVVVKGEVDSSVHKAASGALALDVTADRLADVVTPMLDRFGAALVVEQRRGGVELLAAARVDPVLGTVITVGLGGGAVELIRRTVTLPAHHRAEDLAAVVERRVFGEATTSPGGDGRWAATALGLVDAARALAAASEQLGGALVECNPVIPIDGGELMALDARVVVGDD